VSPLALITAPILYAIFSFAASFAGLAGAVVTIATLDGRYISNICHALDSLLAAVLGWSGRKTVSSECGNQIVAGNPCRFCRVLCAILGFRIFGRWALLEFDHCRKNAST
jgi:hypothetical protein